MARGLLIVRVERSIFQHVVAERLRSIRENVAVISKSSWTLVAFGVCDLKTMMI